MRLAVDAGNSMCLRPAFSQAQANQKRETCIWSKVVRLTLCWKALDMHA